MNKIETMKKCLEEISKKFPNSTLGIYSELGEKVGKNVLPTGSISIDYACGGGLARMCCIVGYPSSGKTTIALTAIAEFQKTHPDATVMYCDAEFAMDINYAAALGVDISKMILLQPDSAEEGYNIIEHFIQTGIADIVVIDSVAAMIPHEMSDGSYGDSVQIGRMATLTTKAVSRINRLSGIHGTHIIWINQYKKAVSVGMFDVASPAQMGTQYYLPGGQQFPFYMQQIVQVSRAGQLKQGNNIVSNVIKVKLTKNKISVPYREAESVITFGVGLDRNAEIVTLGYAQGFITQTGSVSAFAPSVLEAFPDTPKTFRGRVKVAEYIENNPELAEYLNTELRKKIFALKDDGVQNKVKLDRGDENEETETEEYGNESESSENIGEGEN